MDWTPEVVVLPGSDIDRAIAFYRDQVGFTLDHDGRRMAGRCGGRQVGDQLVSDMVNGMLRYALASSPRCRSFDRRRRPLLADLQARPYPVRGRR